MEKLRDMIDVNTIIGEEIKLDNGVTIIPISKVTYGFGSGGSNFPSASPKDMFGGGVGAGATVQPLAFLVVNGTDVQLMQMNTGGANSDPVSKAIDVFPELVEKIKSLFKKEKNNTEEENPNPSS
ncbi:MAG: sporulation protein YtfJ [Oscillospiraceae bacterium]|nr:sporulation protein YtfJ [Oscillospiraceae bacterium]